MISKKMAKALNKQINAELYSSYLYLSMSSCASFMNLKGVANWFFVQALEETTHAKRFAGYLESVNERVSLEAIDKPPAEFASVTAMFEGGLEHEKKVTGMIHELSELAAAEKDCATGIMLQWFVNEQVEEEQNATEILAKLKLIGDKGAPLYLLDKELGARKFGGAED
jgi:ferritin